MSKYWRITCAILFVELLLLAACNFFMLGSLRKDAGKQYRVDISRAVGDMETGMSPQQAAGNYKSIKRISPFDPKDVVNSDYTVEEIDGTLYRFEYQARADLRPLLYMNIGMVLSLVASAAILIYIGRRVLRPFNKMTTLSVELARGNLNAPLQEEKSKFFGKFLWGINMLRDNLESNKERELALQKDKKTLILSLSHDIKTPLSAIKLYAKALDENLYDTEEKRHEAICGISHNATEIEKYVSDIVTASKEDFLNLEVTLSEVYQSEIMKRIEVLYREKFSSLRTEFTISEYTNVLLSCDEARLEEVLQNILENAIKYGDGRWVKMEFSDEEDCRLITITNSGCSITEDEIPHLFESFYRGSNSKNVNGSGLGLYIAKTLMRMMDGEIFAKCIPASEGADAKENYGAFAITVVVRKA